MSRVPLDTEAIRALAAVLHETGLTEIEIAEKDTRIRVVRSPGPAAPVQIAVPASAPAPVTPAAPSQEDLAAHPGAVLSPMVGVAYLSPEPGAAPFVAPGQTVAAGQTVLLIEAMKTFNQIRAPKGGIVSRILVNNGSPVEFGEALMILE
jgi:acetyl-CoA carboxylase biotin carboxyl carrier protein